MTLTELKTALVADGWTIWNDNAPDSLWDAWKDHDGTTLDINGRHPAVHLFTRKAARPCETDSIVPIFAGVVDGDFLLRMQVEAIPIDEALAKLPHIVNLLTSTWNHAAGIKA